MNLWRIGMLATILLTAGAFGLAQASHPIRSHPIRSLPKAPDHASGNFPTSPESLAADDTTYTALTVAAVPPIPALGSEAVISVPLATRKPPATKAPVTTTPITFFQPGQSPPLATQPTVAVTAARVPSATAESTSPGSSSPAPPGFSRAPLRGAMLNANAQDIPILKRDQNYGPFSALGVQLKAGIAGIGLDLATPLSQRLNLRAGASFFQYNGSFDVDGTQIDGTLKLRSATVQLDIFPFGGGFRVSPGLTAYNGNNVNAIANVPTGNQFSLGDNTFTSSPGDPVHGTAGMTFGNRTAPSLTVGWGNMIPRSGRHWSVPFEIGFQYIRDPRLSLNLSGTACGTFDGDAGCEQIQNDPELQQDLKDEQNDINSDIHPLRFYPILSVGFAWAFHLGKH